MKTIGIILVSCLLVFSSLAYAYMGSGTWSTTIHAEGQDLGGVKEYNVVIGVGEAAEALPAPPAPPEYSVKMDLIAPDWTLVSKDIRQDGEQNYVWIIAIDPHGNIGTPEGRTSELSWDASEFANGYYELRKGPDGTGETLIQDMTTTTSFEVSGPEGVQYFSVVFIPTG